MIMGILVRNGRWKTKVDRNRIYDVMGGYGH